MKTDRRQLLKVLSVAPAVAAAAQHVHDVAPEAKPAAPHAQKTFTAHEWRTVRVLSDLIIPADDKSGSATQAGVPEYIDEVLTDRRVRNGNDIASRQEAQIKGGLAWLDRESHERFSLDFAAAKPEQQRQILNLIAWPKKALPEHSQAVAFFNRFRDMTASGFYTSKIGIADIQFKGNTAIDHWDGCPKEVLEKLGF